MTPDKILQGYDLKKSIFNYLFQNLEFTWALYANGTITDFQSSTSNRRGSWQIHFVIVLIDGRYFTCLLTQLFSRTTSSLPFYSTRWFPSLPKEPRQPWRTIRCWSWRRIGPRQFSGLFSTPRCPGQPLRRWKAIWRDRHSRFAWRQAKTCNWNERKKYLNFKRKTFRR